jgi:hypothetical protein
MMSATEYSKAITAMGYSSSVVCFRKDTAAPGKSREERHEHRQGDRHSQTSAHPSSPRR